MADIINFTGKSRLHIDPDVVLDTLKTQLIDVVVLGWKKDDGGLAVATSEPKASEILYLLKVSETTILDIVFGQR
jgi:hypothetical protein